MHSLRFIDWIASDSRRVEQCSTQWRPDYVRETLCDTLDARAKEEACRLVCCIMHAVCSHGELFARAGMCVVRCCDIMLVLDEGRERLKQLVVLHAPDMDQFSKLYNVRGHRQIPYSLAYSLSRALRLHGALEHVTVPLLKCIDAATSGAWRHEGLTDEECAPVASGVEVHEVCALLSECTHTYSETTVGTPPHAFESYDLSDRAELYDRFSTPRRKQSDLTLDGAIRAFEYVDASSWPECIKAMARRAVCISAQASQRPGCFITDADLIPEAHLVWYDAACARHLVHCNDTSPRRRC